MPLPSMTKVFSDKLKIVFACEDISSECAEQITEDLNDRVSSGDATKLSNHKKGFRNRYRIPLTDKGDALIIDVNPMDPKRAVWRMAWEYNPSKLDKEQRKNLRQLAKEILGTDARRLLSNACVYELHVTIDFPIKISDVAIESRSKSVSGVWGKRFNSGGLLQNLYFGTSESGHHQTAYDKRDEILAALALKYRTKIKKLEAKADKLSERLRIEDRQRQSRCPVPLHRLDDLREPFAGFHIYSYVEAEKELDDQIGRLVLELAKSEGLHRALKLLDKSTKETVRRTLAACQVEWWDASKYHRAVHEVLKATYFFPKEAFNFSERQGSPQDIRYEERKAAAKKRGKPKRGELKPGYFVGLEDEEDD